MDQNNYSSGQQGNGNPYYQDGQNPYGQGGNQNYSQNPYYGQNYDQGYGQNPYGQGYNQNPYGQGYDQNQYNQAYNGYDQAMQAQQYYTNSTGFNSSNPFGNNTPSFSGSVGSNLVAGIGAELLNSVLTKSFLYMFVALLITAITSISVASSPSLIGFFFGNGSMAPLIVCFVLEIGLVIACTAVMKRNNVMLSAILFFSYAVVNGITFTVIFMVYQLSSIVTVFFMTSVMFGILAAIGAITKKDLSGWGPVLFAGLLGILIGSVVNIFAHSRGADFLITAVGIVVFMGLTIYDVNRIKKMASENSSYSTTVLGLYGAMQLYLDFINLFLKLLRLMGKRK